MSEPTPTERAITNLRARRAARYPLTESEQLLLGEVDRLSTDNQELHLKAATDEKRIAELEPYEVLTDQTCPDGKHPAWLIDSENHHACPWCEIDQLKGRLSAVLDACTAADQQYPTTGSPRDPAIRVSAVRQAAGQTAAVTA